MVVVERDDRAVGASVRNFGHIGITTQSGRGLAYAQAGRRHWLALAQASRFWIAPSGTLIVARNDDEWALLEAFAQQRPGEVNLLSPRQLAAHATLGDPRILGGADCANDLRVNSVAAVPAIAEYLRSEGVVFRYETNALQVHSGCVETNRGRILADRVIVTVGHDTDRLFPQIAESVQLRRCLLHMLEVDAPTGTHIHPVVLAGTAVLRYGGLQHLEAAQAVRLRLEREQPELLAAAVNIKLSQRPNGRLVLGDTHSYAHTHSPFRDEALDQLLLREFETLIGAPLRVRRRWHGEYASSPTEDFVLREPQPGVYVATVGNGTGMSCGFGFAEAVLDAVLQQSLHPLVAL